MKMINPFLLLSIFIFCTQTYSFSQSKKGNYIDYYNFVNEAEYNFYEMDYPKSLDLFEKAFKIVDIRKPDHHYNYCRALWEVNKTKKSIKELKKAAFSSYFLTDTTYFENMALNTRNSIVEIMEYNGKEAALNWKHTDFIDSLTYHDQRLRRLISDSIEPYYSLRENDTLVEYHYKLMRAQDIKNGINLITYSRKHGFPAGVNGSWDQSVSRVVLHLGRDWIIENYNFLMIELKKGNIEPIAMTRAIDRYFVDESNCNEKVSPFNSYFGNNLNDPFLLFMNCKSMGLSPYYGYNWRLYPKGRRPYPTEQCEVYRANKAVYNTTF
ncbi:hypothetical protein ERX46_07750 [Brumimicrobium glaciale]|uniref:Uncharacterized protein n=1 Tax=Brumimicrobium glaciale TaxID=200475 RepID=A0A4Q4KPC7_9FLAO|nr:hypothetical protein [Brumimicrobium glaciale]RYM33849.1 hypothetical protein ERX46_07750 [Brumimicrobium glaciale]